MYLLLLASNQIFPFVYRLCEVNGVHGDLDLTNGVMFTKTVKVENLQHQSLTAQLAVGYLERGSIFQKLHLMLLHAEQFDNATDSVIKAVRARYHLKHPCTHLKGEGLIEDWTQVLALNFGLKLLLLVRQHVDFDVGV